MRDVLGPNTILGYCTNVHAGASLNEVRVNLERYAVRVKERVSPNEPMGVGLWFSARAARELLARDGLGELRDWLGEQGLLPYTINGFPYGDFHEPVVKHRVYAPDWTTAERQAYTLDLAIILAGLIPEGGEGSISTLPIGWPRAEHGPHWEVERERLDAAGRRLTDLVHSLARLELDTGRLIHVDLEPEPGCILDTAPGVVRFFEEHLLGTRDDESVRAYLRVCHDVCHSAVMFEPQAEAVDTYRNAGIRIGKVQLSSAVSADISAKPQAAEEIVRLHEPRYLHQTTVRRAGHTMVYEDLPHAMEQADRVGEWRVHFHVPLYLDRVGALDTTRAEVRNLLAALRPDDEVHHFEIETYAWTVLPEALRTADLAEGIAQEFEWVRQLQRSRRDKG